MEELEKLSHHKHLLSAEYSRAFEHHKWMAEIPSLDFGEGILIKPIPPFAGAVARFLAYDKRAPEDKISVYLDCYDILGWYKEPYWELYPIDGDTHRTAMKNGEEVVQVIKDEFARRQNVKAAGVSKEE